ncbi:aminotransferase class III-fold pyridoxal phosphate-dependent enzyme (plasmid) [Ralstonia solanacearum P673]|uniref:aminotransferase class III-fold pyridoxal phosphate-dependent enzyme n=1 Tax=Ralstonia solanacearum TaxID=305 RepID=UPI000447D297|nr:aminotransferase class III-fold pyridoxal phosphate-dependent enzyme [Ralstonia solanacearum]EUJ12690.1 aminotransferase [Ralstonia solanacearum P673]MCL9851952.1 aminotransferase class III-fold pyridoxal phosphate-dependent enzyme [Ralstonia solanacearum]MCL9856754.1 aminotransferase class III-fold pyridoxal phosphate-dependent enzyme [Ralstonia solanacearum]MCL9861550.1 aminotransferase class III-fold pyridoxal phosphate-dependent enzyme [Ralstonia solanacearum]MCL9866402.1 aminotransfera
MSLSPTPKTMKFGFIAHPTSVALKRHVKIVDLLERTVAEQDRGYRDDLWQWRNLVPFADFGRIVSAQGAVCEGILHYMPLTAEEMLSQPRAIAQRVVDAVDSLKDRGAQVVGLGGFTAIVGNRGLQTLERTGVPVTTGNSLTAYAAYKNVLESMEKLDVEPADTEVAVVGYPGSIALVIAKLLARHGCRLCLVHRGSEEQGRQGLAYLPESMHAQVRLSNEIERCYDRVQFYVAATSTGGLIDPYRLRPGSVVVDAALPRDVKPYRKDRNDILIIDGGLVSASSALRFGAESMGLAPKKFLNGCLAETLILGLEGRAEAFSIGRELPEDKVVEIGRIAALHGFSPSPMASYGEHVEDRHFAALKRFHRPHTPSPAALEGEALREEVLRSFGEHINPILRDFYVFNHIERVFQHGRGCTLTDINGEAFLDFVAGYGCLNTGHNHPRVKAALQDYLQRDYPTFVQYVSVPLQTSQLAQRLSELAPGRMERVFFSNSGTEAVEAALKLAIAAMSRPRVLYCDNGYHGKTLGALSVTGRDKHRAPFKPLLPRCDAIPFGDAEALEAALQTGDVGAFIVEPIQGEGGVILPPDGYLAKVRQLCSAYDCILILDEIQTGLGRTGKMFACEWEGVEPDIMVLSKSLSGGAVPIGATLSRKEIWDRAYGNIDNFALHTSTFGGGNLAAAAGLATLDVLAAEDLAGNAGRVGESLRHKLAAATADYPFIREVRGRGLMIAIEFSNSYAGGIEAFVREFANRMPGDAAATYRMLSGKAKQHIRAAIEEVEKSFEEMFVLRFVTKLSQEHGILTFVTANNNRVMRIQPPLVLDEEQAQRFVDAFSRVCKDMSTFLDA